MQGRDPLFLECLHSSWPRSHSLHAQQHRSTSRTHILHPSKPHSLWACLSCRENEGTKHSEVWRRNSMCEHASLQQRAASFAHPFFMLQLPETQLWLFLPLLVSTGLALTFLYFPGAIKVTNLSHPGVMGSDSILLWLWEMAKLDLQICLCSVPSSRLSIMESLCCVRRVQESQPRS